jgi:hypothetical protein
LAVCVETNVAMASTKVPPAVVNEAMTSASTWPFSWLRYEIERPLGRQSRYGKITEQTA